MLRRMLKRDVLRHFDPDGSKPSATARAIGVTPGLISQWGEVIPEIWARRLPDITKGKLRFDRKHYANGKQSAA
jgi:hypothetical protein